MPYMTVEMDAEVALRHNGVTVYHVYKCDDIEQGRRTFWFDLTGGACPERDGTDFDARELTVGEPLDCWHATDEEIRAKLVAAIDAGELVPPVPG